MRAVRQRMQHIIKIEKGITRMPEWRMAEPVDFTLDVNEHIAIVGSNGSGKSMLVDIITGKHPLIGDGVQYDFSPSQSLLVSDNVKHITFRDNYGSDNDRAYFLQQRWNQTEIDPETPIVGDLLEAAFLQQGNDVSSRRDFQQHLYNLFHMNDLLDKYIILLSSGEMRKFQLIRALFSHPRVLIMDNPFIGLDAETRVQLRKLLTTLSREQSLQIMLVLSKTADIPDFITHVVEVKDMIVGEKKRLPLTKPCEAKVERQELKPYFGVGEETVGTRPCENSDEIIKMNGVCIRYGNRTILKNLNWTVYEGERWALSGPNGSGKSTLLSLVCADNPQSYACDIRLFGHQRGSGESIWDIKRNIGYVSPEMHRAYNRDMPAIRIVASGLHDSIGLYVKPTDEDLEASRFWMEVFGLKGLENRSFLKLSSGEQRLVLVARAFVKDPRLLILDEPLHGLDNKNCKMVKDIIESFCQRPGKTLIMITHYEEELPDCITHRLTLKFPLGTRASSPAKKVE